MSVVLKADNRSLVSGQKYSYLSTNYLASRSNVVVTNSSGFSANDYVLLGEFSNEQAEVIQISTITSATHTLNFATTTKFAHPESTRVTVIPYNQVRFYRTTTAAFSAASPLTGYTDISPDSYFSSYSDATNSTGYGWFIFYNSTTGKATSHSNAIPYANFSRQSVKKILDSFFSLLSTSDLKEITYDDAMSWLNEGYTYAKNELNLANDEYNVSDGTDTISGVIGTKEYALASDFSDIISVWAGTDEKKLDPMDLVDVAEYDNDTTNPIKFFIRGAYIGFSPTLTENQTFYYRYKKMAEELTSYYDDIDLPNGAYYSLPNYILFKAGIKLNRNDATKYLELFAAQLTQMKLYAFRRDGAINSFSIDPSSNV